MSQDPGDGLTVAGFRAAREESPEVAGRILLEEARRIVAFARVRGSEADDLVQEVVVRVLDRDSAALHRAAGETALRAWLFCILRNVRREAARSAHLVPVPRDPVLIDATTHPPTHPPLSTLPLTGSGGASGGSPGGSARRGSGSWRATASEAPRRRSGSRGTAPRTSSAGAPCGCRPDGSGGSGRPDAGGGSWRCRRSSRGTSACSSASTPRGGRTGRSPQTSGSPAMPCASACAGSSPAPVSPHEG